ncbi:acetyl/propionyl/methylcrotonyl-CoA carboxylase subunit alpha [Leptospira interrogans]
MLKKVLVANRGEIAQRIIRTARRMGIRTVAVASEPDLAMPFAQAADEVVPIGPGPATESYLDIDKIIAAAKQTGADGIHPGYGFLSENADFADAVAAAGLAFIGPTADAMRKLGGKAAAKAIAIDAGVPVVPGYQGDAQDLDTLRGAARQIGYPVMIKAVAGGGGRGMRLVEREEDFASLLASAQREAQSSFGDARVLIEKVVQAPRHIEVQVFGDAHGNVVHLFERDCTLQRRNQKVIEEAPAPGMTPQLRNKMTAAAVKLAKAVGYRGAGTVEFLVEGGALSASAGWYFIEMNTRLQVEHPVTEAITGLDLVEWQLRVAAGEPLPLKQSAIACNGHAIEARLCAEDAARNFLPSIGRIAAFDVPDQSGLRVDAGVETGSVISPFYDSMIAKLITHAPDRETAIAALLHALEDTTVAGVKTNAAFLHGLLAHPDFRSGKIDTGFIARNIDRLTALTDDTLAVAAGVMEMIRQRQDDLDARARAAGNGTDGPWSARDAFQLGPPRQQSISVAVDGATRSVAMTWRDGFLDIDAGTAADRDARIRPPTVVLANDCAFVVHNMRHIELSWPIRDTSALDGDDAGASIRAPINGRVTKVFVSQGDTLDKGQSVAVIEAMKMEHVLTAARAGTVAELNTYEGQQVAEGAILATLAEG